MPPLPLVSVVTPSYRQGSFIEATLRSVMEQDYPNVEHIVVDGGSTDQTLDVLRSYEGRYELSWVCEPDEGQADAIRKGFARASGSILCWLNSDDIFLSPRVISQAVGYFRDYPGVGIVTGNGMVVDSEGRWVQPLIMRRERISAHYLDCVYEVLQPATFFRREVAASVELDIGLHYAFDWAFFREASRRFDVLPVPDVWAGYRWWGQNKTAAGGYPRAKELLEVQRRFRGRTSWQYWIVAFFVGLHGLAQFTPAAVRPRAHWLVTRASGALSEVLRGRVTQV